MRTIKIVTLSSSSLLSLCYCNITYNDNEKTLQLGNRMKSGLTLSSDNVILKHKGKDYYYHHNHNHNLHFIR